MKYFCSVVRSLFIFFFIRCDYSKCSRIAQQKIKQTKKEKKTIMLFSFYIFDHAEIVYILIIP